jgi:mRNA interferase MazF
MELDVPGLPKRSWLKLSQVRTLAVERVGRRITRVAPEVVARAVEGLVEIVGD